MMTKYSQDFLNMGVSLMLCELSTYYDKKFKKHPIM